MNFNSDEPIGAFYSRSILDKWDAALLHLSSFVSVFFSVLQIFIGGYDALSYFAPLLIVGWYFPFYVGYYRGALKLNSLLERIRGWGYLVVGSISYVVYLIYSMFIRYIPLVYMFSSVALIIVLFHASFTFLIYFKFRDIVSPLFNLVGSNDNLEVLIDDYTRDVFQSAFAVSYLFVLIVTNPISNFLKNLTLITIIVILFHVTISKITYKRNKVEKLCDLIKLSILFHVISALIYISPDYFMGGLRVNFSNMLLSLISSYMISLIFGWGYLSENICRSYIEVELNRR